MPFFKRLSCVNGVDSHRKRRLPKVEEDEMFGGWLIACLIIRRGNWRIVSLRMEIHLLKYVLQQVSAFLGVSYGKQMVFRNKVTVLNWVNWSPQQNSNTFHDFCLVVWFLFRWPKFKKLKIFPNLLIFGKYKNFQSFSTFVLAISVGHCHGSVTCFKKEHSEVYCYVV
jgi:hypothetical protein